jgi:hypothetical protein
MEPDPERGIIQFHTDTAHLKEWPGQFEILSDGHTVRPPQDFVVSNHNEVGIHSFTRAHAMNANGTFNMYFDPNLESWLEFVAKRRGTN